MLPWVEEFVSELHAERLKPLGFTRKRHTFSRCHGAYVERFQIQGSSWNSPDALAWTFYLNAGVTFPDLPAPNENRGFPGTHVYGRLGHFDADCIDMLETAPGLVQSTQAVVVANIERASAAIASNVDRLRSIATAGRLLLGDALRRGRS